MNMDGLTEKIQKINIPILSGEIKNIDMRNALEELTEKLKDNLTQPQCIILFIALITFLQKFGKILSFIFAIVSAVIDTFGTILGKLTALTIAMLKPIIKITVFGLMAYFSIAAIIDTSFLCIFILLIILAGRP